MPRAACINGKQGWAWRGRSQLRGPACASDHRRSVQSADADRKRPGRKGDQATAYTGPRWPAKVALYCSA